MHVSDLIQILATGVALGSIYTLIGNALLITYRTSHALNFGLGDLFMVAAFASMALMLNHYPVWLMVVAVVVIAASLGLVIERVAVRPLASGNAASAGGALGWILTTLGFGLILQNVVTLAWGKSSYFSPPLFSSTGKQLVSLFGASVYLEELACAASALAIVGGFYAFLFRTRLGAAITTVAFDHDTAALLGINVKRVVAMSYALMGAMAAVAGILAGPISTVQSHMGLVFLLKGFAVLALGGFASPLGVLIAGIGFGVVEGLSNYIDSSFGDLYPFVLIIAFIIVRPSGLFAERRVGVR